MDGRLSVARATGRSDALSRHPRHRDFKFCPPARPYNDRKSHSYGEQAKNSGPETRSGLIPVRPELVTEVRYFGRYRGGWIRDGVLLSVD